MAAEILNYGGYNIPALQVTTGLYPTTANPLDIRTRVRNRAVLTSSTAVGCKLYTGLQIYIEDTKETATVKRLVPGADGSKWNHWEFDFTINAFKDAIDDCWNPNHHGRYDLVFPNDYTIQNLLNYLFLRCNDNITVTHTLTIEYVSTGGLMIYPSYVAQVPEGEGFSVESPEKSGYDMDQPTITGVMGITDLKYTVIYTAKNYILNYYRINETDPEPFAGPYSIPFNSYITTPQENPEHPEHPEYYTFNGWQYTPTLIGGNRMPASDVIATARWLYNTINYTVTLAASPTEGGRVDGAGTFTEGTNVEILATPDSGYNFLNWTEGGVSVSTEPRYIIDSIDSDHTLTAHFDNQKVEIVTSIDTIGGGTGGTVTGGNQYNVGSTVSMSAIAANGYRFVDWYENGTALNKPASWSFTANISRTLVAKFIKQLTLTSVADPSNGGEVTGGGTYDYGATVTLTATPKEGFIFKKWTINGSDSEPASVTVTMNSNTTATAYFDFETIHEVRVMAFSSTELLDDTALSQIDWSSRPYTEVNDNQTEEAYRVHLPARTHSQYGRARYLVVAIPASFTHGTVIDGYGGTFFMTSDGFGGLSSVNGYKHYSPMTYNGTEYLVVESVSIPANSDADILFGNTSIISGMSWQEIVEKTHLIDLS